MSLSQFELLKKIGEGSYLSVYKVLRKSNNKIYALKQVSLSRLTDKEKKHAINEIRFIASIDHPNVISYKQSFYEQSDNALCLVMEFADAGDLYQRIQKYSERKMYLKENLVWSIFVQVTLGLKAIHALGIVHRDIKSANIFLNKDGSVKIGDMNVSKVAKDGFLETKTGTPCYASPEVWKDSKYSYKSDIWSLGCVLYEVVCLKPPFSGKDMDELFSSILKGKYPTIPKCYFPEISKVLSLLLTPVPEHRPSCQEILNLPEVKPHLSSKILKTNSSHLLNPIKLSEANSQTFLSLPRPRYEISPEYFTATNRSLNSEKKLPKLKFNTTNSKALFSHMAKYEMRAKRIQDTYKSPIKLNLSPNTKGSKIFLTPKKYNFFSSSSK